MEEREELRDGGKLAFLPNCLHSSCISAAHWRRSKLEITLKNPGLFRSERGEEVRGEYMYVSVSLTMRKKLSFQSYH